MARNRWLPMVLLVGLVLSGGPAAAADPAGTVAVNPFPTLTPRITVLGATAAGILYTVDRPPYYGESRFTYLKPAGGTAYQVSDAFRVLIGDRAYAPYGGYDNGPRYLMVGSTVERSCPGLPGAATSFRSTPNAAFTSFGWLSNQDRQVIVDAGGCRLGNATPSGGNDMLAADDTGYLLRSDEAADGTVSAEYRSYADPTHPHPVQTGGRSRYLSGARLAGDAISWVQLDYAAEGSYVVRTSASGGPATVSRVDEIRVLDTAILGATTGWSGCDGASFDCTVGAIGQGELVGSNSLVSDGTRFVVDTYGSSPGVDGVAAIGEDQPRTRLATVGLLPPQTSAVAIGASAVAYVDNQIKTDSSLLSAERRPYARPGSTVALGNQVDLGRVGRPRITRDGRRTAYVDTAGDLWIVTDDGVRTKAFDAVDRVASVRSEQPMPFRLSGHRILWVKGRYTGDYCDPALSCVPRYEDPRLMLYDLRTGTNTDLGSYNPFKPAALWGSYLATTDASNRILRKDLSSGAVVQIKAAGPRVAALDLNLTIVGWATCSGTDNFGGCATSRIGYRVYPGTTTMERTSTHTSAIRLTGLYLIHSTQQDYSQPNLLKAWRLGTSTVTTIGPMGSVFAEVHDETLVWSGVDEVARLTPLAPFTARPRYLGNALGSATFTPNGDGAGDAWTPEFAISKALPTCKVTITSGSTVRRTLSCATTVGSARVNWNGRDTAGRLLPKGRYTWTLTGSDADGALLWWTGTGTPITGTVTIA